MRTKRRTATEQAGDLVDYLLANGGRLPHLKAAAFQLTWYQYLCLDVILFLTIAVFIIGILFFWLVRYMFRRCCSLMTKDKVKKN